MERPELPPELVDIARDYLQAWRDYDAQTGNTYDDDEDVARLRNANSAPRCTHIKVNGLPCQSPALNGRTLCYAHTRMLARRSAPLELPLLEDASGIQFAIMQVMQALIDGRIDPRNAGLLLYGLQIASCNLSQSPFEPPPEEVVRTARGLPPEREIRRHQRHLRQTQSSQTPLSSAGAEYVVPREKANPVPPNAESDFSP